MIKVKNKAIHDKLFKRLTWDEIDPDYLNKLVRLALSEDLEGVGLKTFPPYYGDITTSSLAQKKETNGAANLVSRAHLTICGTPLVQRILSTYESYCQFEPNCEEGDLLAPNSCIGRISGPTETLLKAERVLLNFLQHLSGIASQATKFAKLLGDKTCLLDTRKTTPGFRVLEKYAVACGGGWNHRVGLFDRIMFKDNHLANLNNLEKGLQDVVKKAREATPEAIIEVEVDSIKQLPAVLAAKADVILLDNFSVNGLKEAVQLIGDAAYTEASGNVNIQTLPELGKLGLDFVSCGALTHQSTWKDIGLDWSLES